MSETDITKTQEYITAARLVISERRASTSFIQRGLSIGYNRATRIMEALEAQGIVSAPNHIGKRDVVTIGEMQATVTIAKMTAHLPEEERRALSEQITAQMRAADQKHRTKQGKPPMKPDPTFDAAADNAYRVTAEELRAFIERFELLEAEKRDLAEQQKELMAEAKGRGYDTKVLRKVVALRKRKPDDIAEEEAVLDLYKTALGMQ